MAICGFPCGCECLTGIVTTAAVKIDGVDYLPGSCADSPQSDPGTWCCDFDNEMGHNSLVNDLGMFYMSGVGGDPGTKCNCKYSGEFRLYANGDYSDLSVQCMITLYVYDSGIMFAELTMGTEEFSGYGSMATACIIMCYDKTEDPEHPFDPPIYTPRQGSAYFVTGGSTPVIVVVSKTAFNVSISITAPDTQTACKNTCIVSQRVYKDGAYPMIRISRGMDGRCPTVSEAFPANFPNLVAGSLCSGDSVCADDWKSTGWHCREFNPLLADGVTYKKDCYGNNKAARHEYVYHKSVSWPSGGEIPCVLDCCDVLEGGDYAGAGFGDPGAWWIPVTGSGWVDDPAAVCLEAIEKAWIVWMFEIFCNYYYQAIDPTIPQYIEGEPNPEWPWPVLQLAAPCGVTCQFYDSEGGDEITGTGLQAYPGDHIAGIAEGHLLSIMTERTRLITDVVTDPPPTRSYELCDTETYLQTCGTDISPVAPSISITEYDCPDCHPGCFENGSITSPGLPGYVGGRVYSEVLYDTTRDAVIAKAKARITYIEGSEGNTIPYAHTPSNGCCASAWSLDAVDQPWADAAEHAKPCAHGIRYDSVHLVDEMVPDGDWEATVVFCCQCLWDANMCSDGTVAVNDSGYSAFFKDYTAASVAIDGEYCRDFATGEALAAQWSGFAETMYGEYCWAWLNDITTGDWAYVDDVAGTSGYGTSCVHATTNHGAYHLGKNGGTETPLNPPEIGYHLVCEPDGGTGYQWRGSFRVCRWCDPLCTTAPQGSCESNPCLEAITGGAAECYRKPGTDWTPIATYCTADYLTICEGYIGNKDHRGVHRELPYIVKCDGSLLPDKDFNDIFRLSGCGVHYCADKCGKDYNVGARESSPMYSACRCYGSAGGSGWSVGDYLACWQAAIADCNTRAISCTGGLDSCSTVAECCDQSAYSTDTGDYYNYDSSGAPSCSGEPGWWFLSYGRGVASKSPWPNMDGKQPVNCTWFEYVDYYSTSATMPACTLSDPGWEYFGGWGMQYCDINSEACGWLASWTATAICT